MVKDKYERYLLDGGGSISIDTSIVLEWWINIAQRIKFPLLSRMTIDIQSISAISAEVERVFSNIKITINDKRQRLKASIIETIKYLKS